ncbi:4-(cytidine 5'-diphospho)-2-C-methyl-D-erythritol kinase [Altererythrobacter aquiaggeris]|uniref:4-(cytidine 5'-diphospho)-2-C-methyl-D-erythritol kinase n=1 Tax=Aestuarierythrobacter aquiaggeris TaxID=1898396 RepID=UPI003018D293
MALRETAYAKINLALHVRARRPDGYHELETIFAFVDDGDLLTAAPAAQDRLTTVGEFAPQLTDPFDNIVAKTLSQLPRQGGLYITLEKRLPVAAGLGGGSADAGAVFRLVRDAHGLPEDWKLRAAKLGADVPACVASVTCIGRGTGTELAAIENDLAGTPVLLVNPGVALSTAAVFNAWDGQDRGTMPTGSVSEIAQHGRNDLEKPAISQCPVIADVLATLAQTPAFLVRMSGSGATCFALYRSHDVMREAAEMLDSKQPAWWQMQGALR